MRVLVFGHVPPPHHGQSMMVAQVLAALRADPVFAVEHIDARLSRDAADIGRIRSGKLSALLAHTTAAIRKGHTASVNTLYYFPAPPKRAALYRDWIVLARLRRRFPRVVFHWQAGGLGEWVRTRATAWERAVTRRFFAAADLSIVLGESLRSDAGLFGPRNVAVIRNGIPDPCPGFVRPSRIGAVREAVFLGLCCAEKGLFDAMDGIAQVNRGANASWRLTVAGDFADESTRGRFERAAAACGGAIRHSGFVTGRAKHDLLARADALLFPTYYRAETQGLVVAEALAHDLPVVVTPWRAVAETLPERFVHRVEPERPEQIAAALQRIANEGEPHGALRRYFLENYTVEIFARKLTGALHAIDDTDGGIAESPGAKAVP